jgi:hypothetical protein
MYNILCKITQNEWCNNNRMYKELKYGKVYNIKNMYKVVEK